MSKSAFPDGSVQMGCDECDTGGGEVSVTEMRLSMEQQIDNLCMDHQSLGRSCRQYRARNGPPKQQALNLVEGKKRLTRPRVEVTCRRRRVATCRSVPDVK